MIDIKKEVNQFLGFVKPMFQGGVTKEFKKWNPETSHDLKLFYMFTTKYLIDNSRHEVPKEIIGWKGTVLDFGGGAGNVAVYLANNGCSVDYIDINYVQQEFVKWLRKKYNLNLIVSSKPYREYDYIVLRDVIEHIEDYPNELRKSFEFLKKGGSIFAKPEFAKLKDERYGQNIHFHDKYNFEDIMRLEGFVRQNKYIWRKI